MITDQDRLAVVLHQTLMHMEADLAADLDKAERLALQRRSPDAVQSWRDAVMKFNMFKAMSARVLKVLDFYGRPGV